MKVIGINDNYRIYNDEIKSYNELPCQTYIVRFEKMTGFYLEKYSDIEINEKAYGVHLGKVHKVLKSFDLMERNLGVILSGDKGIGKSLFAKILATEAIKKGTPVIVVDKFSPGIASFLESIKQSVMVLFDEFDKTFGEIEQGENETEAQTSMLSLFDGISQGKKLFVITCNEIDSLNEFLINRPGRFHYHIRFPYPKKEEIREYLEDKLSPRFWEQIEAVEVFSEKINLNYDCLRSIAFEIEQGIPFKEAITDLNIINLKETYYEMIVEFENGCCGETIERRIDLFDKTNKVTLYTDNGNLEHCYVSFYIKDCKYSFENEYYYVDKNDIDWKPDSNYENFSSPQRITIKKSESVNYRYMI